MVVVRSRDLAEETRQQRVDGVALSGCGRETAADEALSRGVDDTVQHIAVRQRKIAVSQIEAEEVEQLVLDDGATDCAATLDALLARIEGRERVPGVETGAAEEVEAISVHRIPTAFGYRVDDTAHGAAVLGRIVVRDNLKLLNDFLRELRLDARAAGVLVIELLCVVIPVEQKGVIAGHAAEA